ncbi:GspH/FimT family pseudopilin [Acinetobacter sp. MD2(2019)]|nr:GspH/FimT family pseudopilin [Acinetobacter sp. MD2(2019)]
MCYGMTLIELVCAIAVLAIITSIALPHYHSLRAKQEAQYIPTILHQYLSQAKYLALTHRNNLVICSSKDLKNCEQDAWNHGFILFLDSNQNKIRDNNELILAQHTTHLNYGTLSWRGSLRLPSITFQGDTGLPRGSMGSFYYCSSQLDVQHRVVLNMLGNIRKESDSNKC